MHEAAWTHRVNMITLYFNHIKSKDCIGYVICKTCKQALKHYKSTSGTTHLNDHLKRGTCKYYRSRMEPHGAAWSHCVNFK